MDTDQTEKIKIALRDLMSDAAAGKDTGELFAAAYGELRSLARSLMRGERIGHTLQPTALLNETYLRLISNGGQFESKAHFFGVASRSMRQVLIEHARRRGAVKREGGRQRMNLSHINPEYIPVDQDFFELDDALARLALMDERSADVVEMRFYGGMTMEEIGVVLRVSRRTVQLDWQVALMWLRSEFKEDSEV